ncbi:glycosyltransferase family 2 protein [Paenibacillus albiflavus]|nr:glycosyltransferase family 2 protein [Paenibacillus albiflavus]
MMPLLSIIVPVYNVENYLDECLLSIVNQAFRDYEVILVNNASKDNSGKICDEYALKYDNIKVIHLEVNILPGGARNVGLQHATGQYIHFCDSDDYYVEESLSRISDILITYSPTVLFGQFNCVPEKGAFFTNDVPLDPEVFKQNDADQVVNYLFNMPFLLATPWRVITKREFLISENLRFVEGYFAEDEEWIPKVLCSADSFALCSVPFYCYRPRATGSYTATKTYLHSKSHLMVAVNLLRFLSEKKYDGDRRNFILTRVKFLLGLFATRCDTFDKNQMHELAYIIESNKDILSVSGEISELDELVGFINRYGPYMGLCLYRTFVVEYTLELVFGKEDKDIYIFPTGYNGEGTARMLLNAGYNVKGFFDNSSVKNGCLVDGLLVNYPSVLKEFQKDKLSQINVIVSIQRRETSLLLMEQLRELGLDDSQFTARIY